jgi:hypothetical protein
LALVERMMVLPGHYTTMVLGHRMFVLLVPYM